MAKGWGYHVCAGCRRAHPREGLRFPLTCDCGHVSKAPRAADLEQRQLDPDERREPLSGGGYQVKRTPLLD